MRCGECDALGHLKCTPAGESMRIKIDYSCTTPKNNNTRTVLSKQNKDFSKNSNLRLHYVSSDQEDGSPVSYYNGKGPEDQVGCSWCASRNHDVEKCNKLLGHSY